VILISKKLSIILLENYSSLAASFCGGTCGDAGTERPSMVQYCDIRCRVDYIDSVFDVFGDYVIYLYSVLYIFTPSPRLGPSRRWDAFCRFRDLDSFHPWQLLYLTSDWAKRNRRGTNQMLKTSECLTFDWGVVSVPRKES